MIQILIGAGKNFENRLMLKVSESKNMVELGKHFDWAEVVEEVQPKVKKPKMYIVILFNDDFTPMDFVVDVIMRFFANDK